MYRQSSKAVALLGGIATLALGSAFMLRAHKPRAQAMPCAPRLLELERAVCDAPLGAHEVVPPAAPMAHGLPNLD
jgi:hypothetical protein